MSQSVPLSHYPYRDSVGQDGTRRPRQYFSRDAPRASAKTMGDVIQKGQPQEVGQGQFSHYSHVRKVRKLAVPLSPLLPVLVKNQS